MEPSVALRAIRQVWYIVVLAVLGAMATAVLLTTMAPLTYSTSSTYVVSPGSGDTFEVAEAVRTLDTTRGRAIVATYVEILSSDAVQAAAAGELGADPSLLREFQIEAVILPEANVVSVTVTGPNPQHGRLRVRGRRCCCRASLRGSLPDLQRVGPRRPGRAELAHEPRPPPHDRPGRGAGHGHRGPDRPRRRPATGASVEADVRTTQQLRRQRDTAKRRVHPLGPATAAVEDGMTGRAPRASDIAGATWFASLADCSVRSRRHHHRSDDHRSRPDGDGRRGHRHRRIRNAVAAG